MNSISIITVTRDRPQQLIESAAASLEKQIDQHFEWVVINDGGDRETKDAIARLNPNFPIIYADLNPTKGFGLCRGRNLGLELATGELIAYLDDDNQLKPNFVERTLSFFDSHPQIRFAMPLQNRRRDIIEGGQTIKRGKPFISPQTDTTATELIEQKQLFDSNGFTHYRKGSPNWNPDYRIYCDYEYFLQCFNNWEKDNFALLPEILVDYVQTNDGVIGRSSYRDWALELEKIVIEANSYSILQAEPNYRENLQQLPQKYREKEQDRRTPEAFSL